MKVKQLIKLLEQMDPEANVYVGTCEYDTHPIRAVSPGLRFRKEGGYSENGAGFLLKGYFESTDPNIQSGIVDVQLKRAKVARESVVLKDVLISSAPNPENRRPGREE
jgi:hypothetical protein